MEAEREETRCCACCDPDPAEEQTTSKEAGNGESSAEECPPGTRAYTVAPGEDFFDIARRHNTSLDALLEANPTADPDRLRARQRLCVPEDVQTTDAYHDCPGSTEPYTLRRGDTLFNLARHFSTTIDAILDANPGIDPDRLEIGGVICIPVDEYRPPIKCPRGTVEYKVGECQTLFRIANRFGLTVREMLKINPHLPDPDDLQVGQIVCVPPYEK